MAGVTVGMLCDNVMLNGGYFLLVLVIVAELFFVISVTSSCLWLLYEHGILHLIIAITAI